MTLKLYTRPDCCLCDDAKALLDGARLSFTPVNIETDLGLIRRFGDHVPVLENTPTGDTLFWPFDQATIDRLVIGQTDTGVQ
jgi:hypothetical protein